MTTVTMVMVTTVKTSTATITEPPTSLSTPQDSTRAPRAMRAGLVSVVLAAILAATTWWLDEAAEADLTGRDHAPFSAGFLEAGGVRWRYLEAGDGPPLVCVHGAYGGAEDWVETVGPELSTRFRVVAFDRPGHGFTERGASNATPSEQAASLVAALDALEIERPLLMGFSWGGAVSAALVAEHPERAAGAVLLGAPLYAWDGDVSFLDRGLALPVLGPSFARLGGSALARLIAPAMLEESFAPESAPADFFERSPVPLALRVSSLIANARDMAGLNRALGEQSGRYGAIRVPIEVVHGSGDQVVWTTHHAQPFAAEVPSAVLTELPGAGHHLLYTRSADVIDALDRLSERVD